MAHHLIQSRCWLLARRVQRQNRGVESNRSRAGGGAPATGLVRVARWPQRSKRNQLSMTGRSFWRSQCVRIRASTFQRWKLRLLWQQRNLRERNIRLYFLNGIINRPLFASRRIRFLHISIPFEYTSAAHTAFLDRSSSEPLRYFWNIFRLHHGMRR